MASTICPKCGRRVRFPDDEWPDDCMFCYYSFKKKDQNDDGKCAVCGVDLDETSFRCEECNFDVCPDCIANSLEICVDCNMKE